MTHELYKTKEDIENWLNQYEITNYELVENNEYGYVVNVNKYVNLSKKNLEEIKVKFNKISGHFNCNENNLKTLKGSPNEINGSFDCRYNKLKNLKECPKIIKRDFFCNNNQLNTLEYFPQQVNEGCYLENNPELGEIQDTNYFEELYKIHKEELISILNNKLEKEINIDKDIKTDKIKL